MLVRIRSVPRPTAIALAALLIAAATPALAQSPPDSAAFWRETARRDLAAAREIMNTRFILPLHSPGAEWDRFLGEATRAAERDVPRVVDAAGYRSVMQRFMSEFDDAHARVRFLRERPLDLQWPGFVARYRDGQVVIARSERADVKVGAAVTACDAKPIDQVFTEIMPYEQVRRHLELESTRAALARALFVDARNSLRPKPSRCRIGGQHVALEWRALPPATFAQLDSIDRPFRNTETSIELYDRNAAWVRMPSMGPGGDGARQFARVIEQAPTLRSKDVIVIDVRGNPGGPYNWFVTFLDSLYGPEYAGHYARARLQFANIMAPTPPRTGTQPPRAPDSAAARPPVPQPRDRLMDAALRPTPRAGGNGTTLTVLAPTPMGDPPGPAPANPVRGRVFVLIDNGCGSACISFVDEMQRFPGVLFIGRETYVDSYAGSAASHPLPSGEATITVPAMLREWRQRGNNFAWKPDVRFDGDIGDTRAIRAWIRDSLMK